MCAGYATPLVTRKITGLLVLLFALSASPALGSTHTWTGAVNQNWSVAGNWTGGVPSTGESGGTIVDFPAGSTSTMDISGLVVDQINFTGSGSTISGGTALGIDGAHFTTDINDANGGNAITEPVALSGATSVQVSVSSGQLAITGVISGSPGLIKTGAGTLSLITSTNTYAGVTDVQEGVLAIKASSTFAIPGALIIGTGAGAPGGATVRDVTFGNDIAPTSNVTVNADGVLDISGGSVAEQVGGLTVNGGSVTLGALTLTLNGPLAMTGGAVSATTGLLKLGGDVTATSSAAGPATIGAPVALDGPRMFTVTQGSLTPDLAISNVISDGIPAPASLNKAGTGTLALSGSTSNTYTGDTNVQEGTLTLFQTLGFSVPGNLTIGTGAGAPGSTTLRELQASDLAATSNVTVNSDGVFDLNGHSDVIAGLTVNSGSVLLAALGSQISIPPTGSVTMSGGTIAGPGGKLVLQNGELTAMSSAHGAATISAPIVLSGTGPGNLNPTFTVNAGIAPELVLSGAVSEAGGTHGLIKAGAGTLRTIATNTYSGTTAITAGTFIADGQVPGPVTVAPQSMLTGKGVLGSVTVAGTLIPQVGLQTGPLSFSAGGSLNFAVPSTDPSTTPTVTSSGPVAIDPAAVFTLTAASGLTVPGGSTFHVITNTGTAAISGSFAGAPFTTPDGVPLAANDAGGDGNDLVLTAANVAPVVGSISATPTSARTGQAVTFSASPSDANRDKLTTTWNFGDGTTGTGASASHAYSSAGTYTVVATTSDGAAQGQASTQITITTTGRSAPSVSSTAFGARFGLAGEGACVRPGARFTVRLTVAKVKGRRSQIARIFDVVFTLGKRSAGRDHRAPYTASLTASKSAKPGTRLKVKATAHLRLLSGARRSKSLTLGVLMCASGR